MRFTALLLALGLAATAAHSHDAVDLPELPIPQVKRIYPVADLHTAFQWAGQEPSESTLNHYADRDLIESQSAYNDFLLWAWYVVELSESQFEQISGVLAGIQENLDSPTSGAYCKDLEDRFTISLQIGFDGGVSGEYLSYVYEGRPSLATRFVVVYIRHAQDTELRETGMAIQSNFRLVDDKGCEPAHTSHSNGDARHDFEVHVWNSETDVQGPKTDWLLIADLLDGNVAPPPAAPEQPADNEDATDNEDALAQLRAELDALRGDNNALRGDLAAVRDSVAWLSDIDLDGLGGDAITRVDTVEIARVDTLHFCPPTDQDRQDLFDAFTGLQDSTAAAPKAAAVRPSSWGQIKALIQGE